MRFHSIFNNIKNGHRTKRLIPLSRGYSRGGRRGRGYRRGRFRGRGSRNHYFEPHQAQFNEGEEHYQEQYESSQKDDSYRNSTQHYNEHPRGRGRGRGRYRGGYRNDRGGYRNDRGGNRGSYRGKGRGGYPRVPPPLNEQTLDTRSKEFKPPQRIQHGEYERRENTSGSNPPICYVEPEDTKVYYQAEDFLKKYDGLPEKTEYLVKEL